MHSHVNIDSTSVTINKLLMMINLNKNEITHRHIATVTGMWYVSMICANRQKWINKFLNYINYFICLKWQKKFNGKKANKK